MKSLLTREAFEELAELGKDWDYPESEAWSVGAYTFENDAIWTQLVGVRDEAIGVTRGEIDLLIVIKELDIEAYRREVNKLLETRRPWKEVGRGWPHQFIEGEYDAEQTNTGDE